MAAASDPKVSLVVVATRNADRLARCLDGVAREAPTGVALEVLVVLNAAEACVESMAKDLGERVRTVRSEVPLGFAGGVNLGVRHARGELLHILHDDAEVEAGWLDPLIAAVDDRPEVGAAGSLVLNPSGEFQTAGAILWRDGRTAPLSERMVAEAVSRGEAYPVDYCASASLLVRRDALELAGGLDERFHPAYYVDVDLAMALRHHGYLTVCEPRSRVRHARGGSSRETFRVFVSERNRELFSAKWADDLPRQAPYGDDSEARSRAREVTETCASRIAAADSRGPAPPGDRPPLAPETPEERLRRERRQLLREVALKDAYIAELERIRAVEMERRATEMENSAATRRRLEADGAIAQRALADLHAELGRLRDRVRELEAPTGSRLRRLIRRAGSSRTG